MYADLANLDYRPDTAAEEETYAHAYRCAFYSLTTLFDCHHKEAVHDTDCVSELKKPDSGLVCIRSNEYTKSSAYHTNATCQKYSAKGTPDGILYLVPMFSTATDHGGTCDSRRQPGW
jgi:hypothetical protein